MLSSRLVLSCVVLALSVQLSYSWLNTGHMLTAQIAQKYLNRPGFAAPGVMKAIDNSLTSLLTYTNNSNTFVTAAVWMDDLKFRGLNQFNGWHYINLPVCDWLGVISQSCNGTSVEDVLTDRDSEQILWAIGQAIQSVSSTAAGGFERGFGLRNLLHLTGDLHQPLHVANRWSAQTPYGDLGGNLFKIYVNNTASELHYFWDSGVNMLNNNLVRPLDSSDADYLSNMADQIMNKTVGLIASMGNGTSTADITSWAMRSYNLSLEYAYNNISFGGTPSDEYIAAAWDVIQDQLGLGGYRLALLLNRFLSCDDSLHNCPESEAQIRQEESKWKVVGIALAVVLGLSVILNVGLFLKGSKRSKYETVQSPY